MRSKNNIKAYEELKDRLRKKFRKEKLGQLAQQEEVTKLFLPVTKTLSKQTEILQEGQKKELKAIHDKQDMQLQLFRDLDRTPPHYISRKRIMSTPLHSRRNVSYHGTQKEVSVDEFDPLADYESATGEEAESSGTTATTSGTTEGEGEEEEEEEVFKGDESVINLGPLAQTYLSKYATKGGSGDPVFGIRFEEDVNGYFIGNKVVSFGNDDIYIENNKFEGTPDLWELLTSKEVKPFDKYSDEDLRKYYQILRLTSAVHHGHDVRNKVKSSSGFKYIEIIKPYWEQLKEEQKTGKGLRYYDNPNDLCDRLIILFASKDAGNNSHNDEIAHILKELKDTGFLSPNEYFTVLKRSLGKCK